MKFLHISLPLIAAAALLVNTASAAPLSAKCIVKNASLVTKALKAEGVAAITAACGSACEKIKISVKIKVDPATVSSVPSEDIVPANSFTVTASSTPVPVADGTPTPTPRFDSDLTLNEGTYGVETCNITAKAKLSGSYKSGGKRHKIPKSETSITLTGTLAVAKDSAAPAS